VDKEKIKTIKKGLIKPFFYLIKMILVHYFVFDRET